MRVCLFVGDRQQICLPVRVHVTPLCVVMRSFKVLQMGELCSGLPGKAPMQHKIMYSKQQLGHLFLSAVGYVTMDILSGQAPLQA